VVLALFLGLAANQCSGKSSPTNPGSGGSDAGEGGVGGADASGGKGGSGGKSGSGGTGGVGGSAGTGAAGGAAGSVGTNGGASGAGGAGTAGEGGDGDPGGGVAGDAGENGGGGAPSTFVPTDLGDRLVLWLNAGALAQANGDKVAVWSDLSTAANHAQQSVDAYRPTYTASAVNGLPAVTFDGLQSHLQLDDTPTLRWGTGDFAILVVARGAPSEATNAMLYQKSNLASPFAGPNFYVNADKPSASRRAQIQLDQSTYTGTFFGVDDTVPRLFGGTRKVVNTTSELAMRLNGVTETMLMRSSVVDIDAPGQPAIIGHNGYTPNSGFQAFEGDIAEICAVKGAMTADELSELESYLMDKYALP